MRVPTERNPKKAYWAGKKRPEMIGHTFWDNPETRKHWFTKGLSANPETQFKKGIASWNKGKGYLVTGVNNPAWKGGLQFRKENEKKHLSSKYREWMFAVKNRDSWKCRTQDETCVEMLEAHHILNWIDFPEARYDVNNGITLCHAHHPRKWAEEKRLIPVFQGLVSVSSELH